MKPLISKPFSFGLSERTLFGGEIEKPLDETEIELLISKLKLLEVKNVALCFLHSRKNPQNEKLLGEKLKSQGFQVFYSHEETGNERERAQKTTAKACLEFGSQELAAKVETLGFKKENLTFKPNRPTQSPKPLQNSINVEFLEDRVVVTNGKKTLELQISPLSAIEIDSEGLVHIGPYKIDSEPGPVIFGKGIHLTALDVFAQKNNLEAQDIPRLKLDQTRVLRHLGPLAQNLRLDQGTCGLKCLQLFQEAVALEIEKFIENSHPSLLIVGGWLGPSLGPTLARRLGLSKISILPHCGWSYALQLLGGEIRKDATVTKIGALAENLPGSLKDGESHDL
jgi:N-methylhydantoinase A/oxoprolinase/acetone carboxylase beta subunit